jgi:ferredoxin-nitrate reductase
VHLSEQAVEPPGEARSDLDIWLDYARRMDFRDTDGAPLVKWHDAESAYAAWRACSKGRPCDYSPTGWSRRPRYSRRHRDRTAERAGERVP